MAEVKLQKSPNGFRIIVDGVEGDWALLDCLGTTAGPDKKIYGAEPTGSGDLDEDIVYELVPVKAVVETLPEDGEEVEDLLAEDDDDDDNDPDDKN